MTHTPLYAEAFRLMTQGMSIIPLGKDKRPLLKSWKLYQTHPATEQQLEEWWALWPEANIGIVTGQVSGITVIDIDAYKPGAADPNVFPKTHSISTGNKGVHLYYKYQPGLTISANAYPQYPHLDIRSDGGFIVAPPSVTSYPDKDGNKAGGAYVANDDLPLADFPIELFPQKKPKKTLEDTVGAPNGQRNDSLASVAGQLLLSAPEKDWFDKVLPAVEKINETYNPPLPLDEVRATFNSIVTLERNRRAATSGGDPSEDEDEIRRTYLKNKTAGTFMLAQYLVKKFEIITVGTKEYEMYIYRNGIYFQAVNEIIFPEIQRVLGPLVNQAAKMETFNKVASMTMSGRTIFESAPLSLIPLLNGVYDRDTRILLSHDAKYRFTYQLPISYDKDATCPKTSAFLDTILDSEQRTTVEEWLGYYFHRSYMFKKAIIFVGEGDTGKTTLLEVIDFMLGKDNISSVSLQKMSSDKFAAAHMFEKHGNLVDELSAKDISDTGNFKVATGGGSISGEYKFGNQFSFHNFSKLTFACNKIPDVKDFDDQAYFNRWMVIRFDKTIENRVPNFIKNLATDAERSGLFNLAMEGLDRLLANGRFSYAKDAMDTKREMMRSGSSIAQFAAEGLTQELGNEITKEDLYDAYCDFCAEMGVAADTIKMLGTKLPFYVSYLAEGLVQVSQAKRVRGWRNVALVQKPAYAQANATADSSFI